MGYARRHWYGQHSLAWSFWFNLVAVRVLVFLVQSAIAPSEGADYRSYRELVLAAAIIFHAALFIWQVVGVVRAAESHFAEHGNMALVWGAQLGCVLMFLLTAAYALGAVQMTMVVPQEINVLEKMNEEHARQYTLTVSADERTAYIDGSIELGITRAVNAHFRAYPNVENVVLSSSGGNIYEGRGLAKVFAANKLNTHVETTCASACTIAFVGGQVRSASTGARFGFHQYRVDADYTIIATDVAKEQLRDQQLLIEAGVGSQFVDEVFSQPSTSMWWPELEELVIAGFVHETRPAPR